MAIALFLSGSTQSNPLHDRHIIAQNRSFPDHHAIAMVNKDSPSNRRRRMDIHAKDLRYEALQV